MMAAYLPLSEASVLDLSRGGGGAAACVRLLGQLGAQIERAPADAACSAVRGNGHELVVTDLQPGEARSLGVDGHLPVPDHRGVTVSVTPFGLTGPDADRAVAGSVLDGIDPRLLAALAGAHGAVAALAALRNLRRHGRSAVAEVAAIDVVASCMGDLLPPVVCGRWSASQAADGTMAARLEVLPCADGWVGISAPTPEDREMLAAMVGADAGRDGTAGIEDALRAWLREGTRRQVFETAQLWRLPCVPVLEPAEVLGDEQCEARGVWRREGERIEAASPFRYACSGEGRSYQACGSRNATRRSFASLRMTHAEGRLPGRRAGKMPALPAGALPLSDIRVLDLGMVWAGPYCGRLLASLGAQVAKVEGPSRRDGTRPSGSEGCSGVFGDLNAGKASLVLDLRREGGRHAFLRLARGADVVIENFSPRVMGNFGLDYRTIQGANPRMLALSMPAFGASGPWTNCVAYGSGLELATGLASRDSDGTPRPAPVAYLDYLSGAYGAAGLLAALLARDRGAGGVALELAQREVACQLLEFGQRGTPSPPAPSPCQGEGSLRSPGSRKRTRRSFASLRMTDERDPAFDSAAITRAMGEAARGYSTFSVSAEAMVADRHLAARGMFAKQEGSAYPCRHLAGPPWRIEGVEAGGEAPPPGFGADTRWLLRRWAGLRTEEIERLVRAGVAIAPRRLRRAA